MMSPTVMRGLSEANGSWNTICSSLRFCRNRLGSSRSGPRPATAPARGWVNQAEDGAGQGRLAGAGFADDAQGFARIEVETDAVDRLQYALFAPQQAAVRLLKCTARSCTRSTGSLMEHFPRR